MPSNAGSPPATRGGRAYEPPGITKEEYMWVEELYSSLQFHEDELIYQRTAFFVTALSVLAGAFSLVYVSQNPSSVSKGQAGAVLALMGIVLSVTWALVLRRTIDALELWRARVLDFEEIAPQLFGFRYKLFQPHMHHESWGKEHEGVARQQPGISPLLIYRFVPWIVCGAWVLVLAFDILFIR